VSSKVAAASVAAIAGIHSKGNLYCIDLPSQYKGGLIYRNGFNEAMFWLAGVNDKQIQIISRKEMNKPLMSYTSMQLPIQTLPPAEVAVLLRQLRPLQFFSGKDVLLKWTDSALLIIK